MNKKTQILESLKDHQITYTLTDHAPVHFVEDIDIYNARTPGVQTKNILLWNKKTHQMILVISDAKKKLDIKNISKLSKIKNLSFVPADKILQYFSAEPGYVSPLLLIHSNVITIPVVYIDQILLESDTLAFHPGTNTATIDIAREDLIKLFNMYKIKYYTY
jgi:Ala-tRNA(Pro) deacylase